MLPLSMNRGARWQLLERLTPRHESRDDLLLTEFRPRTIYSFPNRRAPRAARWLGERAPDGAKLRSH